ncbi:MAG: hypothetical protein HDS57_03635 [Barnesiella sp.]|nr:hypothetical protein [Barnesiella sp.]
MVVYHGTNSNFNRFDNSFLGANTDDNACSEAFAETAHIGFWFTDNEETAGKYYDKVMECELNLDNPYYIESLGNLAEWIEMSGLTGAEIREQLEEMGHDGIEIGYDEEFKGESYIVFDADNIEIL